MLGIIHIGTEKTGSTSIQNLLRNNSDSLRDAGIATLNSTGELDDRCLATYAMKPHLVDDHIEVLGIKDASKRTQWRDEFRSRFLEECSELKADCDSLIFSSEHLHSRLGTPEDITKLLELLSEVCSEFRIIVYLRRQDRIASSYASTYFKSGQCGGIPGFLDHLQRLARDTHYFDYNRLLAIWSDVFGKQSITPRLYNKDALYKNNLLSDFINAADLSVIDVPGSDSERINVSLSNSAIAAMEKFSHYFPAQGEAAEQQHIQRIRARFINHLENEMPGRPEVFTQNEAKSFYAKFRDSNNEVARKWFDAETLFVEDFSDYPLALENSTDESAQLETVLAFFQEEMRSTQIAKEQSIEPEAASTEP